MLQSPDIALAFEANSDKTLKNIQLYNTVTSRFLNQMEQLNDLVQNSFSSFDKISKIGIHYHNQHLHQYLHSVEDISTDLFGNPILNVLQYYNTFASLLSAEFYSKEDKDGNGKIIGTDFIIDPSDNTRPIGVKILERYRGYDWTLPQLTWSNYLSGVTNGD